MGQYENWGVLMDTIWTYRALVVPDAQVTYARELTAAVAGPAGAGMFTAALSPTGSEPATHWISAGMIADEFAALLPLTVYPADAEPIHTLGQPETVAAIATAMPGQLSSTAQDMARGRTTEIDHLNGFVVRRGAELGVPTPVNQALHALVKLVDVNRNAG